MPRPVRLVQGLGLDTPGDLVRDVDEQVDVRPAEFDADVVNLGYVERRALTASVGLRISSSSSSSCVVTPSLRLTTVTLSPRSMWWAEVPRVYVTSWG